jgi:hypothetical protein
MFLYFSQRFAIGLLLIFTVNAMKNKTVAEFIDPDWGDKVNSGIGLSYRPVMVYELG